MAERACVTILTDGANLFGRIHAPPSGQGGQANANRERQVRP